MSEKIVAAMGSVLLKTLGISLKPSCHYQLQVNSLVTHSSWICREQNETMESFKSLRRLPIGPVGRFAAKWFLLSALIGLVAGLGAIDFQIACQTVSHFSLGLVAGFTPGEPLGESRLYAETLGEFSPWLSP